MEIRWEVEDGYVGKSRPQRLELDDDELRECESEDELMALLEDAVKGDFDNKISWALSNWDEIVGNWREL